MPTELEELKQIHAELSKLAEGDVKPHAVIEKRSVLYKQKPEGGRPVDAEASTLSPASVPHKRNPEGGHGVYSFPRVFAFAPTTLSTFKRVAGEVEPGVPVFIGKGLSR